MRNLSLPAMRALSAEAAGEVFLTLITIEHDDLDEPIRVVNDLVNHTSRGNEFLAYPFEIVMPLDDGQQFPQLQLTIDNVDLTLVESIRTMKGPAKATIEVVLASSPDHVELALYDMWLREIQYDAYTITGKLYVEDMLNQKFPNREYLPTYFPGLFK